MWIYTFAQGFPKLQYTSYMTLKWRKTQRVLFCAIAATYIMICAHHHQLLITEPSAWFFRAANTFVILQKGFQWRPISPSHT
jgi:hypothetical protein